MGDPFVLGEEVQERIYELLLSGSSVSCNEDFESILLAGPEADRWPPAPAAMIAV
jgi:hypothetical protein